LVLLVLVVTLCKRIEYIKLTYKVLTTRSNRPFTGETPSFKHEHMTQRAQKRLVNVQKTFNVNVYR